jgi:hypothetical protein
VLPSSSRCFVLGSFFVHCFVLILIMLLCSVVVDDVHRLGGIGFAFFLCSGLFRKPERVWCVIQKPERVWFDQPEMV